MTTMAAALSRSVAARSAIAVDRRGDERDHEGREDHGLAQAARAGVEPRRAGDGEPEHDHEDRDDELGDVDRADRADDDDRAEHQEDDAEVVRSRGRCHGRRRGVHGGPLRAHEGDSLRIWRRSASTPSTTSAASTRTPARRREPFEGP